MQEKQTSAIIEITLSDATFEGSKIQPTFINFFFGNNGTGKTTISRLINRSHRKATETAATYSEDPSIVFADGSHPHDYNILVFNRDFIDDSIKQLENLPGVFTMNEDGDEIPAQIANLTKDKDTVDSEIKTLNATISEKEKEKVALDAKFREDCWRRSEHIRTQFPESQAGVKSNKKKFIEKLLSVASPADHNEQELFTLYQTAFDPDAHSYRLLTGIDNTSILDTMEDLDLLLEPVVSSGETDFSQFIKALNATDWIRQGHEHFTNAANGKCPYCQRTLPDDFEKQLTECFDEQYQIKLCKLIELLEAYKSAANNLFVPLQENTRDVYPQMDLTEYRDKLELLRATIKENIQLITEKSNSPSMKTAVKPVTPLMDALNQIIAQHNAKIKENNDIVASKQENQAKCTKAVWEMLAYFLKDDIESYHQSIKNIEAVKKAAKDRLLELSRKSEKLNIAITDLTSRIKNTSDTIRSMNRLLKDSGFHGFTIREKPNMINTYEVIRPDGSPADKLSEGERNFIAFLYFYHLVHGIGNTGDAQTIVTANGSEQISDGTDRRDKIVVIDDPVSSMDSASLFVVSSLVREMISICHNNVSMNNVLYDASYIKQIFILTHNAYFHREITANQERHFRYVSFYLVTKTDNISTIRLCVRKNPTSPTDLENYNPVQNSYAALWTEFKEVSSSIPLMNVMRRILEYYFIQICGYEGIRLQDRLLIEHKDKFIIKDPETGTEDTTHLQIASSLLQYVNSHSFGINDGLHYVDDCVDMELCKITFKMIFDHMDQTQHYEMMMGIND